MTGSTTLSRAAEVFLTRLQMLARLLAKADGQWRSKGLDPDALCAVRLAADMHPLTHQVVFTCNQANDFAAWCAGSGVAPRTDAASLGLLQLHDHVEATIKRQGGRVENEEILLGSERKVELGGGRHVLLSGHRYINDWLMPNFHFHLVTSYDVLRHAGVSIGKADYMDHLAPHVRREGDA